MANYMMRSLGYDASTQKLAWEKVGKLSERRYGFYCGIATLHAALRNKSPFPMEQKLRDFITKLRNDVAHNGYIPNEGEVTTVGNIVYEFIIGCCRHVINNDPDYRIAALSEEAFSEEAIREVPNLATMSFSGPMMMLASSTEVSLEELISRARKFRKFYASKGLAY